MSNLNIELYCLQHRQSGLFIPQISPYKYTKFDASKIPSHSYGLRLPLTYDPMKAIHLTAEAIIKYKKWLIENVDYLCCESSVGNPKHLEIKKILISYEIKDM